MADLPDASQLSEEQLKALSAKADMKTMLGELIHLGWSAEGARTFVAEVSRENSFDPITFYGQHRDSNNHLTNVGPVSWQGQRAADFTKFMDDRGIKVTDQGLMDKDGHLFSEDALKASVQFADQEMKNKYPQSYNAVRNPNLTYDQIEPTLSNDYFSWDRAGHKLTNVPEQMQHMRAAYDQSGALMPQLSDHPEQPQVDNPYTYEHGKSGVVELNTGGYPNPQQNETIKKLMDAGHFAAPKFDANGNAIPGTGPQPGSRMYPYVSLAPNQIPQQPGTWYVAVDGSMHQTPGKYEDPFDSQILGFEHGFGNVLTNIHNVGEVGAGQLFGRDNVIGAEHSLGMMSAQEHRDDRNAYFDQQEYQGRTPGKVGEFLGSVAATAPVAAVAPEGLLGAALGGAATGGLTTNSQDGYQIAKDIAVGAGAGSASHLLLGGLAGAVAPKPLDPDVNLLIKNGVKTTPGQTFGRTAADGSFGGPLLSYERGGVSSYLPFTDAAERRAAVSFPRSAVNRAVAGDADVPGINVNIPKNVDARAAAGQARAQLDKIAAKAPTKEFAQEPIQQAAKNLDVVDNAIGNDALGMFSPQGLFSAADRTGNIPMQDYARAGERVMANEGQTPSKFGVGKLLGWGTPLGMMFRGPEVLSWLGHPELGAAAKTATEAAMAAGGAAYSAPGSSLIRTLATSRPWDIAPGSAADTTANYIRNALPFGTSGVNAGYVVHRDNPGVDTISRESLPDASAISDDDLIRLTGGPQ